MLNDDWLTLLIKVRQSKWYKFLLIVLSGIYFLVFMMLSLSLYPKSSIDFIAISVHALACSIFFMLITMIKFETLLVDKTSRCYQSQLASHLITFRSSWCFYVAMVLVGLLFFVVDKFVITVFYSSDSLKCFVSRFCWTLESFIMPVIMVLSFKRLKELFYDRF